MMTAAVAIFVSMIVSFSLTPMMCSRMLRFRRAKKTDGHAEAASRRGFYHWLERGYMASLGWSMRHPAVGPGAEERRSIAVLAVGGQSFSLLLTLLAVPVIYSFFDDLSGWLHRLGGSDTTECVEPVDVETAIPVPTTHNGTRVGEGLRDGEKVSLS